MSICCHRSELLRADRVIWRVRPGQCQRRGGDGGGVVGAACMERCCGVGGLGEGGGVSPEERGRVGVGRGGSVWRGPLGPLNLHVQARGREALIRHVTGQSYSLKPQTTALRWVFILNLSP